MQPQVLVAFHSKDGSSELGPALVKRDSLLCLCHFQPLSNLGIFTEETAGKIAQEVQRNSTGNSSLQEQRVRKGDHGELLPPPKGTGCSATQK